MKRIWNLVTFLFLISLLRYVFGQDPYTDNTLSLAVHPYLSYQELETRFAPLIRYLSNKIKTPIELGVGASYEEHMEYVGMDKVDIAYMGPASYVKMVERYGNKPLLAKLEVNGESYFQGNIVSRIDSNIHRISDLRNKRIAFGDPNSTMSYIAPFYVMHKAGVFEESETKYSFYSSHTNVAIAVLAGDADAGAVKPDIYIQYKANGLKLISKTPKISEHLFVTRTNLPNSQMQALRTAMLTIAQSKEGRIALKSIKNTVSNLVEVSNEDYDNLRVIITETFNAAQTDDE